MWYSAEVQKQVDSGINFEDVDVDLKLSVLKPIHATWLVELYNFLTNTEGKERRVAQSTEDPIPLHVGDSVLMHVPPRPGFPSKLQSRWQGPFIVVKCLQGNTYRIKQANNFRKRFLRHRDQLRVPRTRPERLRPTEGANGSGHTVIVPPVPAMFRL